MITLKPFKIDKNQMKLKLTKKIRSIEGDTHSVRLNLTQTSSNQVIVNFVKVNL